MKTIQWLVVSAALVVGMAAPASAATSDPEVIIYRFPGVADDGGISFVGTATAFHCTNFSGVQENIRFVTRSASNVLANNTVLPIVHLSTISVTTHLVHAYAGSSLATGLIAQGTTAIAATSTDIICTAMTIDAAASVPAGVTLRGIRFNPVPGSQE